MNSREKFKSLISEAIEESNKFKGWDFSYLVSSGRMFEFPLKWNYCKEVKTYLKDEISLLDMGTGGGEILASLSPLPQETHATEQYPPNYEIAKCNLGKLGVNVHKVPLRYDPPFNLHLPFSDNYFDVIINRHEGYSPDEVYRILKPNGYFITQQVGSLTCINLISQLTKNNKTEVGTWNLIRATREMKQFDFEVEKEIEELSFIRFSDIGAIVYYLNAIPWIIEDFSVNNYYNELYRLHQYIENHGYFDMLNKKFLIVARKK